MHPILVALPHSPWSEKARWALDHHRIGYSSVEYVPLVYEPLLRIASREVRRKATVPILLDGRRVLRDSLEIARYADECGRGEKLVPAEHEGSVVTWNDHVERFMQSALARLVSRLLQSPAALPDELPSFLRPLGSLLNPVVRVGLKFVAYKFDTNAISPAASQAVMTQVLERAAAALNRSDYLVEGRFTLADLALASALGFVEPHALAQLADASRAAWREPELNAAFPSLVAWRDRMIERHRP